MSLGIGVANACLLQQDHESNEYLSQGRSGTEHTAIAERQAMPDHLATHSVYSDENASSPGKMTCLHFCLAEQSTLITVHLDGLAQLDHAPLLFLTGLLVATTDQISTPQAFARPTWSEPPVSIRYLRLTI
jgi:hypothetical protein